LFEPVKGDFHFEILIENYTVNVVFGQLCATFSDTQQ
jgi:hypothetical protein